MRISIKNIFFSAIFILSTLSYGNISYAQEAAQPEELNAVFACKAITNPDERLSCYDTAVGRFETAQKGGDIVTVSKKQIEKVERDAFGFNIPSLPGLGKLFGKSKDKTEQKAVTEASDGNPKKAKSKKVKKAFDAADMTFVELEIKKTTEFGYKKTRFFMANGQVWEQTDGSKVRVPKVRNGNANTAKISKASLGSFFLRVNGKGKAIRVQRVR